MSHTLTTIAGIYLLIAAFFGMTALDAESAEKREQRQQHPIRAAISFTITNLLWPLVIILGLLPDED